MKVSLPFRSAALLLSLLLAHAARAQEQSITDLRGELARIRNATTLQAQGDLAGAEKALRAVVQANPTSLSGLLMLEQVLGIEGRLRDLLPLVDTLLQRDPRSAIGHQQRLRTLSALDSTAELERATEAWIAATPNLETPYREAARIWSDRKDLDRATRLLERGRKQLGTPTALALELGDAYAARGELERAAAEWDRAIGMDGRGFLAVQRRLRSRPDGGSALVPRLLAALTRPPVALARQRAALQLALDAGLSQQAESIARPLLSSLGAAEREPFLADVARRADGSGLNRMAYWAYGELIRAGAQDPSRLLALRTRHAQLALAMGDTVRAAADWAELERASAPGSPQRRQAVAVRIRIAAAEGRLSEAVNELTRFRQEFADAAELDETAAAVAEGLLQCDSLSAAEKTVAGIRGPRSTLVRGRLFLRQGDVVRAASELMAAAPALRGQEGTHVIALAAALTRIRPATGELISRAFNQAREDPAGAVQELVEHSHELPDRERAAVLDFAASLADDAGLADAAEQVRREIVADLPGSDAAPAALLWLAQRAGGGAEQQEQARVLLERLIVDYPRSALVPQARRELDRMARRETPAPARSKAGAS